MTSTDAKIRFAHLLAIRASQYDAQAQGLLAQARVALRRADRLRAAAGSRLEKAMAEPSQ
ncbi:hypothetical protein [Azospirillum sp. TSH7]|nr:hypothetical protein [Azospirillum sp. TSH7]